MTDTRTRPPKLRVRWGKIAALLSALGYLTLQTYMIWRLFTV